MKLNKLAALTALPLLAATTYAQAAVNPAWQGSVVGAYIITDDSRFDADYGVGLRFGAMKQISERWNIEPNLTINDIERDKASGQSWQYGLGLDGLFMLNESNVQVNPYLVLGAGAQHHDAHAGGYDTNAYWNAGIGLLASEVLGPISLRADVRYVQDFTKDARVGSKDPYDDVRINVGINFPLSAKAEAPQPVVRNVTEVVEVERVVEVTATPEVLEGVNFEFDSERLTANARRVLSEVVERLKHHSDIHVEISGHTDSQGSAMYNEALSLRRANAVKEYLVQQGIASQRLSTVGQGFTQPVASNSTEEGREANRRIEMRRIN